MNDEVLRSIMVRYAQALVDHRTALDELNVFPVADADTGTNLARTMAAVVAEIEGAPDDVREAVVDGALLGARGNSGVILSQYLRGFVGAASLAEALGAGAAAARDAVAEPVEGTVLTVAAAAAEGAEGDNDAEVLASARAAAVEALARTPEQLTVLAETGVVDAGGAGFLLLLDAALEVVDGRPVPPTEPFWQRNDDPGRTNPLPEEGRAAGPRYEVTFLLAADEDGVAALKAAWAGLGDSIAISGAAGTWRCHVHTDDIGAAVEAGIDAGRPSDIRVEALHR